MSTADHRAAETPDFQVSLDRAGRGPAGHSTRPEVQLLSPDFYANFDELTTWMRAEAPFYWDDATGIWGAAAHADVTRMSREYQVFCSGQGSRPESSVPSMINTDPPDHTRRRRLVGAGFTPRRVADHEPYLRRKVTELIDAVIDRGECDIVADIATPLPMYMIGELMGLPEGDHEQLLHWSDLFATGGEEIRDEVIEAVTSYNDYIMAKVAERRDAGGDDLVSLIVNADFDGDPLADIDVMFETMLVLVGGDETTRDVEIAGQQVRAGDRILLLYPSANRDEAVFDDPFRFDIERSPNDHVAFGAPAAAGELRARPRVGADPVQSGVGCGVSRVSATSLMLCRSTARTAMAQPSISSDSPTCGSRPRRSSTSPATVA